jgi:hypothetical protein
MKTTFKIGDKVLIDENFNEDFAGLIGELIKFNSKNATFKILEIPATIKMSTKHNYFSDEGTFNVDYESLKNLKKCNEYGTPLYKALDEQ